MKRSRKTEIIVTVAIFGLLGGSWLLSEVRWERINTPKGKFTNVREYIAYGRRPSRVTKVEKDGKIFFIAYSPMDTWLAVPSGPAAYVFDEAGQMVEWSWGTGDDSRFQKKWPLPQEKSSFEELKQVGFQPQGGGYPPPAARSSKPTP